MTLPLLSTRDGAEIVAALLGHARATPNPPRNVAALDSIFEEIVDSLRIAVPRPDIEAGASAVASVLNALQPDPAEPRRRQPRKKRYHQPTPSTHCHVCCRPSSAVRMAVCSNITEGTCRKVVCSRCIVANGMSWDDAVREDSRWICPHCTDACARVSRAQCWVYSRTNSRRRRNGIRKRKAEDTVRPGPR